MKKISLILVSAVAFCHAPAASAADFTDGIFEYTIKSGTDVMASIVSGSTVPANVVIPTEVTHNGVTYTVTHLAGWMFKPYPDIESVTLPERMTTFEWAVFENCKKLTNITLPASVTWLGDYCFNGCSNLESINIPDGVVYIGNQAFQWDSKLAINNKNLTIKGTTALSGTNMFAGVPLERLEFGEGITSIPTGMCCWNGSIKDLVFPSSLTEIGAWAFQGSTVLTSVNLKNVTTIKQGAFDSCEKLVSVKIEATTPPTIENENAFATQTYAGKLIVPKGSVETYKAAPIWTKFAEIAEDPSTGVQGIIAAQQNGVVYNIFGVKVADNIESVTSPGIYICNSKKIYIK